MFRRSWTFAYILASFVVAVLVNYAFPFLGLWMLFLLPLFGVIILYPTWIVGNLCVFILVVIRFLTQHAAFSGQIPIDYLSRSVSTSIVAWFILLVVTFFVKKINSLITELQQLSFTDNLTQTFNRTYLNAHAAKLLADSVMRNESLCLLLLDLDNFKALNDRYGHSFGDAVLRKVTEAVRTTTRRTDMFIRLGGEEFALFLPNTSLSEGVMTAERIREMVEQLALDYGGQPVHVTISVGITLHGQESLEQLMEKADEAMYQAKSTGRNKVVVGSLQRSPATAVPHS